MPENIFVKRDVGAKPGFSVGVFLNRKETKGKVGIEVEVEASNNCPRPEGSKGTHTPYPFIDMPQWAYVHDGSLRGVDNAEYVLTKPLEFDEVPDAVNALFKKITDYKTKLVESNRTSVHVHLNCQSFHLNRLTSFMALYFIFEEALTEWCGEHRVGNLFCLRAKDAPAIVSQVKKFIKTDGIYQLQDHLHYSGLNTNALHKFGSLEFRSLRGCSDPKVILDWIAILRRLYDLSEEYADPRDICAKFSSSGPMQFFMDILGGVAGTVRAGISMSDEKIRDSMYEGIRLAQDLCYCRDWSLYQAVSLKNDPFGRDPRKLMKKITAANMGTMSVQDALDELSQVPSAPTYGDPFTIFNQATLSPTPIQWSEPEPEYDDEGNYV